MMGEMAGEMGRERPGVRSVFDRGQLVGPQASQSGHGYPKAAG